MNVQVPATVQGVTTPVRLRAPVEVHLVLGLPKGPAADLAMRMATEAGATAIHPVWASRTQGRPDKIARWRRTATAAATQCGRADVPTVHPPANLQGVLDRLAGMPLFLASPEAVAVPSVENAAAVCVGPEGGWTEPEIKAMVEGGAQPVSLGPFILRSDTACAVAVALLMAAP